MSLIFESTRVARPSAAPGSSVASGPLLIRHRRVNRDGGVSAASPIRGPADLPATLTPQPYTDTAALLRDEFLASEDGGNTWRVVPSATSHTGPLAAPTFSSEWPLAGSLTDNQGSILSTEDLGAFTATVSPEAEFYVYNNSLSCSSITLALTDPIGGIRNELFGRVRFSIIRSYTGSDGDGSTVYAGSLLYGDPVTQTNSLPVVMGTGGFAKIRLSLENFPDGGPLESDFSFNLELSQDVRSRVLPAGQVWQEQALQVSPDTSYPSTLITAVSDTRVSVAPYLLRRSGLLLTNPAPREFPVTTGTEYTAVVSPSGVLRVVEPTEAAGDDLELARFTVSTGPSLASVEPLPYWTGELGYQEPPSTPVALGRFVQVTSTGPAIATTISQVAGVSTGSGFFARGGLAKVRVAGAVSAGELLKPNASGEAVSATGESAAVALEAGNAGDLVLCLVRLVSSTGSGGGGGGGSPLTAKGDLYGHNGTTDIRIPVGSDGQVLTADSSAPAGASWETPASGSLPGTIKGDIIVYDGSGHVAVSVGANGKYLVADNTTASGVAWEAVTAADLNLSNVNAANARANLGLRDADILALINSRVDSNLVGMIAAFTAAPSNRWILCGGGTFNSSIFPKLSAHRGNNTLPNLSDRLLQGSGTFQLNTTGGSFTRTLVTGNLPSHSHTAIVTDPGHDHLANTDIHRIGSQFSHTTGGGSWQFADLQYPRTSFNTTGITVSIGSTGSGTAFSLMSPYYVVNFFIYAGEPQ